jgi:LmbE family N-acetylglucosaminyl deacetylase
MRTSGFQRRKAEARKSARAFLQGVKHGKVIVENFRDGFFPYSGQAIKSYFEKLKRRIAPSVIFTHYRSDLHQDHRIISELAWNTFRDHLILEYEIPKYDGDFGSPNCFVYLTEELASRKIDYIVKYFVTQRTNQWFDKEVFWSLLRLRGIESNSQTKYAEAFYVRKLVCF